MNAISPAKTAPAAAAPMVQSRSFVLKQKQGLHLRPAAKLIRTIERFNCEVTVECRGNSSNARSILGLMSLSASHNSQLTFTAIGPDAARVMTALQELFETDFASVADAKTGVPPEKKRPENLTPVKTKANPTNIIDLLIRLQRLESLVKNLRQTQQFTSLEDEAAVQHLAQVRGVVPSPLLAQYDQLKTSQAALLKNPEQFAMKVLMAGTQIPSA